MANVQKLFYIGRRDNPQLKKPYFKMYGPLSKTGARKLENPVYGDMTLTGYTTEEEYKKEIEKLKELGYNVTSI